MTELLQSSHFPVVGIGASAGGLNAYKKFSSAITPDSGMAYVLIQHLAAAHESMLPEILSSFAKIPVLEIVDDIYLQPDHVFIIPENKTVSASDGLLKLAPREKKASPYLPIDIFLGHLQKCIKVLQ